MVRALQNRIVLLVSVLALLALVAVFSLSRPEAARAAEESKAGMAHYTVVMTEGHNLLVTDNSTNKLYFYTIGKDKPIDSPLKLRASIDLNKVGDDEIRITAHNLEKAEDK